MRPSTSPALRFAAAALFAFLSVIVSAAARADEDPSTLDVGAVLRTSVDPAEWTRYKARFLDPSGRIVDIEKNGVSHSEGQGYGMLLAVKADDRDAFDRMLGFTFAHMRGRTDGLVSWLYDPRRHPRIADPNNASDGDILIAYALVLGAVKWHEPVYLARATPMIHAIGRSLLLHHDRLVVVRPAAFGFDRGEQEDGPVANLSYFIYGAFLLFEAVEPSYPWIEAWQSGLMLTNAVQSSGQGGAGVVPDWVSLARDRFLAPARGFRAASSYDAVRIPLYMALGGQVPSEYFSAFDVAWAEGAPSDVDLGEERTRQVMPDPGYRAIAAVAACAARGAPLPDDVRQFRTTTYFASTLHLLALAAVRENYPECLLDGMGAAATPAPGDYARERARG